MNKRPNLFVVGAMKSFTTSVAEALSRHEDIFVASVKEPHFFNTDLFKNTDFVSRFLTHGFSNIRRVSTLEKYLTLYKPAPEAATYIVDASTSYLYSKEAALNISEFAPDAKIVILLRDPVIRAWSEYRMNQSIGIEFDAFRTALDKDLRGERAGKLNPYKRYYRASLYGDQVERYFDHFDSRSIFIAVVDDPRSDFPQIMRSMERFLEIPEDSRLEALKIGVTRAARLKALNRVLYYSGLKGLITRFVPRGLKERGKEIYYRDETAEMAPEDQVFLAALFEDSTRKLERLTGLDLSHWIRPAPCLGCAEAAPTTPRPADAEARRILAFGKS